MTENTIAQLFDIVDGDSTVTNVLVEGNTKYITITKNEPRDKLCPLCGSRLHSKGQFKRHPNDQILQDGYNVDLTVIGRRWKCSNPECSYSRTDQFDFIEKRKRNTNIIIFQILNAFKDINLSCRQIAERYHISDTFAHQTFMRYINLPRKKLTKYICIDEVYLNISPTCKYALVIMDFITGDILDIIESRRKIYTQEYFLSIPLNERKRVEYLCCDMYDPYINYTYKYFPNARAVTDSFHVLQWILRLIKNYINTVKKRYQARDRKLLLEKNEKQKMDQMTIKDSREVYILKKAQWVMLLNPKKWKYSEPHYNAKLGRIMDTISWENEFLKLDDRFKIIRDLKDLYEDFNENFINDLKNAEKRLDELIDIYNDCNIPIFTEFSCLLTRYHDSIVNSFIYVKDKNIPEAALRRLSNGPLESFNNFPSALRAQSHGISNFQFNRNRILWALRDDAPMRLVPRPDKEIHKPGKKRGDYKKTKKSRQ